MPLDLVGRLHRTVYIDGCPAAVRDDLLRLLVAKCGAIDGWDVAGERLVVVFRSVNSISTAVSFSGTAFGDLTARLLLWVATDTPPAGVAQQLAITASGMAADSSIATTGPAAAGGGGTARTAEEMRAAREAREKRLAAIRSELATDIEEAESAESYEVKRRDLCVRQMKALCTLTAHALEKAEKSLEESTIHLHASQQLLEDLRKGKHQSSGKTPTEQMQTTTTITLDSTTSNLSQPETISGNTEPERPSVLGERVDVAQRVEEMVAAAEDIGKRHNRSRKN
ncbi:uncharacterized protein TM35_000021270 [Trypanosoma theileri]|uniref:RNA-binding protein n=1 Tax=Trypanosoma theileri TaxID=67003 RepID=A0A1X0P7J1_9TRYP|nr:uncharacterized protein TM35_000021270 [Trypanosoma theileri]ORC92801.1 hypothetical protein TM35_000021270 [Trypanosoma theileri]